MNKDRIAALPGNNASSPRPQNSLPPFTPGFAWNSTWQEFIPILPEGHPDYERNREIVAAAIKRWDQGKPR